MTLVNNVICKKMHNPEILKNSSSMADRDIFERLKLGETILPSDPEAYKMREASYCIKKLLMRMNNATDPKEIRDLLGQITGSKIDKSVAVFTPLYINYGKHTKIGKNVFINFDCTFLDLGGITIDDGVLIAPKVSLLSEGHPIEPENRHALVPKKERLDWCRSNHFTRSNHWRKLYSYCKFGRF